ncbi:MAG: NAD(+)/NADH kinase [Planctomycetaceae bacterium]|nr:NAD(+)/NADH kinase [Planctomycetaceae bacterium]
MTLPQIIAFINPAKPGVKEKVDALRPWLKQRVEIVAELNSGDAVPDDLPQAGLCVIFGGDGTLLAAARALAPRGLPLLGVNFGKLGFLAEFSVEDLRTHLDAILAGEVVVSQRMMLDVSVYGTCQDGQSPGFTSLATNDVAVSSGYPFRMIELTVTQGAVHVVRYYGDGLVISTPTGSTGYNMSAGGPILEPTIDAIAITPVAPHTLSMRPIVVASTQPICITATAVNPGTTVSVDGQINSPLCTGSRVEIRRSNVPARIITHPRRTFFSTLTDKLDWGSDPHTP